MDGNRWVGLSDRLRDVVRIAEGAREGGGKNAMRFITQQVLEQSGLGVSERASVFERLSAGPIAQGSTAQLMSSLESVGLLGQLDEQTKWLGSGSGQRFIEEHLAHVGESSMGSGSATRAVRWQNIATKAVKVSSQMASGGPAQLMAPTPKVGAYLLQFQEQMAHSLGVDMRQVTVNYVSGAKASFRVSGVRGYQHSSVHKIRVSAPGIGSHSFDFFELSKGGFLAQGSHSSARGGWSKGQSIFTTPGAFITDPFQTGGGQWDAHMFGGRGVATKTAYMDFQANLFGQLQKKIAAVRSSGAGRAYQEKRITDLFREFQQEVTRFQHYVADASTLSGRADTFGASRLSRNLMAKSTFWQNMAKFSQTLSEGAQPLGSLVPYEIMSNKGVSFPVSSGQAGKLGGLMDVGSVGNPELMAAHHEPHKALGELMPYNANPSARIGGSAIPRYRRLFEGAMQQGRNASLFKPMGVQVVTSFANAHRSTEKYLANALIPDGTALAASRLYAEGALDMGHVTPYKIKATGPGLRGNAMLGDGLRALIEGGELPVGPNQTPVQIRGLKAAGWDWQGALAPVKLGGELSQEAVEKYFRDGVYLGRDALLGIEPGTGRQVNTAASRHITERVIGIEPGNAGEYNVFTSRHIGPTMSEGQLAGQGVKAVEEVQTKTGAAGKVEFDMVDDLEMARTIEKTSGLRGAQAAEFAKHVEVMQTTAALEDPLIRTKYMSGALRYSAGNMEQSLLNAGMAREVIRGQHKDRVRLAGQLASMSDDQLLHKMSAGGVLSDLEKLLGAQAISKKQREVLKANSAASLEQKLVATADILFSDLPQEVKFQALSNVSAPHTRWGRRELTKAGRDALLMQTSSWNEGASASAQVWRHKKNARAFLGEALSSESLRAGALSHMMRSKTPMVSLATFGLRDYHDWLGAGERATLEPRFFDVARANPSLNPVMRSLTSRMTDFSPQLEKLGHILTGKAPLGAHTMALGDLLGSGASKLGAADMLVDLSKNSPNIHEINARINKLAPGSGIQFRPQLYIPGGDDMMSMGRMVTGAGIEKSKELRGIYERYLDSWRYLGSKGAEDQVDLLARTTIDFQREVQQTFQQAVTGVPGGASHGMMRGPVRGSVYAPLSRLPGRTQDLIAVAMGRSELGLSGGGALKPFEEEFVRQFRSTVTAQGESLGQQAFLSRRAANRIFDDAIGHYRSQGMNDMAERIAAQRAALFEGKSVLAAGWRHPAIGAESMSGVRLWLDQWGPDTATKDVVRMGEEYMKAERLMIDGKPVAPFENKLLQTSFLQKMKADHDGDRINIALAAEQEAQESLQSMLRSGGGPSSPHYHSARYHAIKELAEQSVKYHASQAASQSPRHIGQVAALAGPKQITPQISNTFTELKFMIGHSERLSPGRKSDLARFLEVAEQVSIGSKHLVGQIDYNLELVDRVKKIGAALTKGGDEAKQAISGLFDIYGTTSEGVRARQLDISASVYRGNALEQVQHGINLVQWEGDMVGAVDDFHKQGDLSKIMKLFKRTSAATGIPMHETVAHYNTLLTSMKDIHGHANAARMQAAEMAAMATRQADVSRAVLGGLNESIQQRGAAAAARLPSKGIVGVATLAAGSMLAAGVASLTLGPTFTDASSGGAYLDQDYLFPNEVESKNVMLQSGDLPSPVAGNLTTPSYEARIHLPPGAYMPASMGGRLGAIMQSMGGRVAGRLQLDDNRMHLDAITLSRIKNEIL